MDTQHVAYKDYTIYPMPSCGTESRWYGGYEISKNGAVIRTRKNIFPGFLYFSAARDDSIETAKLEIDNIVGAGAE